MLWPRGTNIEFTTLVRTGQWVYVCCNYGPRDGSAVSCFGGIRDKAEFRILHQDAGAVVRWVWHVSIVLGLAACDLPQQTAYQSLAVNGREGYSDERLGDSLYRVAFAGNRATTRERVENLALYRAAELTIQLGEKRFAILDKVTEIDRRQYYDSGSYSRYHYRSSHDGLLRDALPVRRTSHSITRYRTELIIQPFSDEPPQDATSIQDALTILYQYLLTRPDG